MLSFNKNFYIECSQHNHKSGYRIYIKNKDLNKIKSDILPFMDPSMFYKIYI